MAFSTAVLIRDTINEESNIANRTENVLKIPTGWRVTSLRFLLDGLLEKID